MVYRYRRFCIHPSRKRKAAGERRSMTTLLVEGTFPMDEDAGDYTKDKSYQTYALTNVTIWEVS